jgi:hypothetical protein
MHAAAGRARGLHRGLTWALGGAELAEEYQ